MRERDETSRPKRPECTFFSDECSVTSGGECRVSSDECPGLTRRTGLVLGMEAARLAPGGIFLGFRMIAIRIPALEAPPP